MGAIADSFTMYAQPFLEKTHGSIEEMNRGFALAQLCWNLAVKPDDERVGFADRRYGRTS